jgi:chromosome segregation ATPase
LDSLISLIEKFVLFGLQILAVTYQLLLGVQTEANRNKKTLETIESTLGKLTDESLQRVHEAKVVKLLEKKKAWLEVDACNKRVESLGNAVAILKDQLQQADQQLHSLQEKNVKAGKASFAGKVW